LQPRHSPNALLTLDHSTNPCAVKNMPTEVAMANVHACAF